MADSTATQAYTERLTTLETVWWKKLIPVQAPYRWNLKRLQPGRTLDVGCGIGRNLAHLGGNGVGVDHNIESVKVSRLRGFTAVTTEEFATSPLAKDGSFDSILLAHVLEHMTLEEGKSLLKEYLPKLKRGGQVILICPQEAGYKSDTTHVEYMDQQKLKSTLIESGLKIKKSYSFPFPIFVGKIFPYNEHVVVGIKN